MLLGGEGGGFWPGVSPMRPPPGEIYGTHPRGWECRNRRDLPPNSKGRLPAGGGRDVWLGRCGGFGPPEQVPGPPHCAPRPLPCPRSNTPGRTNTTVERLISGGWKARRAGLATCTPPELHRRERLGTGPVPDLDTWRLQGITKVYLRTGPVPFEWPGTGAPVPEGVPSGTYIYILAKV